MRGRAAATAFLALVATLATAASAVLRPGSAAAQTSASAPAPISSATDAGVLAVPARPYADRPGELLELMLWDTVRNERDPGAIEEYLRQYPNGHFATVAKLRLA